MNLVNSGRLQLPTAADRSRRVAPRCCVRSPASLLAVHKCRPELPTPSPTLHSPILSLSLSVKLAWLRQARAPLPPLLLPRSAPPPTPPTSPAPNHVTATLLLRRRLFSGRVRRPACCRRGCRCRQCRPWHCSAAAACSMAGQGHRRVREGLPVLRRRSTIADEPPTTVTDEPQCLLCFLIPSGTLS